MSQTPVLIGAAQYTQRKDAPDPRDPLGLMQRVGTAALDDAGPTALAEVLDAVWVVNVFSWSYRDAPGQLAHALGLRPKHTYYSAIGGNTPQMLVNRACTMLARGEIRAVLIAGAEAVYAQRRMMKGELTLDWPEREDPERIDGEQRPGTSTLEDRYDLFLPAYMYPFFETALRAAARHHPDEHRQQMGRICERLARVAAAHPYAWTQEAASAEELTTPSPSNRYVGYPYTKRMNANIDVDQAAAVVLTTAAEAERLGIDRARWVYPMGGADLHDVWHVTRRRHLHRSPALRAAVPRALQQAGVDLDAVTAFDLYSCFPSAVEIAVQEIGLSLDDPRPLTVTGGLPYFGGPGNNYSMHAIATVVDRIREAPDTTALVTALGWYVTKHSAGVYGARPGAQLWHEREDDAMLQQEIEADALPKPAEEVNGPLTIEAFSIRHDRSGQPERGVVIGRREDGRRALANLDAAPDDLAAYEKTELAGRSGTARFDADRGRNLLRL